MMLSTSSAEETVQTGVGRPASDRLCNNSFSGWAISWANWLITGLLASVGTIVVAVGEGIVEPIPLLLIGISGEVAAGLVLLHAAALGARSAGPLVIVMWWTVAAVARSAVLLWVLVAFSPLFRSHPPWGISAAVALALAAVIGQAATAAMLDTFAACRKRRSQVEGSIAKLRATTDFARQCVLQQQQEIADTYVDIVIPTLDQLVQEVDDLDPSLPSQALGELARDCGVEAREHVRQISHQLAQEPTPAPSDTPTTPSRAKLGLLRVLGASTPPVWGTAILAVCVRLPGEAIVGGPGTSVRVLITACWVAGFFLAVKWFRCMVPDGTLWGTAYLLAALGMFYVLSVYVLSLAFDVFPTRALPPNPFVDPGGMVPEQAASIWLLGAAVVTTLIKAAEVSSNEASERRVEVEVQLQRTERSLALEIRRLREESAHLLHGSVQGRLAMAGVMLRECADETHLHVKKEKLRRVRAAIAGAKADLLQSRAQPPTEMTLEARLAELARKWRGLIDVRWHITVTDNCHELNPGEPLTGEVGDVVTEAVANASRHGQASVVDVAIDVAPSTVHIRASDNGCGLGMQPDQLVPGLGTRLIKSSGGLPRLTSNANGGAMLDVVILRP